MLTECLIEDTFAGPGGWDEGLRMLGVTDHVVGYEWDTAACDTATAAGHARVQTDVTTLHPPQPWGRISSPPCTKFSMAGSGVGRTVMDDLAGAIRALFAGDDAADVIEGARAAIYPACIADREEANQKRAKPWTPERVEQAARTDAATTALVLEPARLMVQAPSEWLAMEQVPTVQPLWDVYAEELRRLGYSVWTGVLNSADYGVPQTRRRSILTARRGRTVTRSEPTHAEHPVPTLWGEPLRWVSMADGLGWGFDEPSAAVTSDRKIFGNADYRRRLGWEFVNGTHENAARRPLGQPAPTIMFGHSLNAVHWAQRRPATTVVGSFNPDVIAAPGYRTDHSRQDAPDSVRVTVQEAAILQSFPPDYPWQGSKTKQYEQVGNAIPPRLAAHVLASLGVGELPKELRTTNRMGGAA